MAKKTVAALQTDKGKDYVKVIKTVKNKKGNYQFIEKIVKKEDVDKYLNNG